MTLAARTRRAGRPLADGMAMMTGRQDYGPPPCDQCRAAGSMLTSAGMWAAAGLMVALTVGWLMLAAVSAGTHGPAAPLIWAAVAIGLADAPAVAAVLTDSRHAHGILWCAVLTLCGVVPAVIPAVVMLISERYERRHGRESRRAGAARPAAAVPAVPAAGGPAGDPAALRAAAAEALGLIREADRVIARASDGSRWAVPDWMIPAEDALGAAITVLSGAAGDDAPGTGSRPGM